MLLRILAAVVAFVLSGSLVGAATLTTTGATGVVVNGHLYDVEFVDGTCVALFDGCDEPSDFGLDASNYEAATIALLNLIDATPSIDADPRVTGCTSTRRCHIYVPYGAAGGQFFGGLVVSTTTIEDYYLVDRVQGNTINFGGIYDYTFSRWTKVTVVPLPASIPLMLGALAILGTVASRSRPNRQD